MKILSLSLSLSLSLCLALCSDIAGCCKPGINCVILGGGESQFSDFPREAMTPLQPYPFGIDPVSPLCMYTSCTCRGSPNSIFCSQFENISTTESRLSSRLYTEQ